MDPKVDNGEDQCKDYVNYVGEISKILSGINEKVGVTRPLNLAL